SRYHAAAVTGPLAALAIATGTTALAILLLGIAVLVRGRATTVASLFFAISASVSGWLFGFALMYSATGDSRALLFARVATAFAAFIPRAVFHFSVVFAARLRQRRLHIHRRLFRLVPR